MDLTTSENASVLEKAATSPTASPFKTASSHHLTHPLPDEPLVIIEPSKTWAGMDLRDLWSYRELLYFLTWRDLKVRYKQTILGVAWVVMQPLLTTIIFTLFLGKLARVPSDGLPYPLFVYAGLLPWSFFAGAVTNSSNSLVGSAHLITKVYFPRMIIPGAAVGGRLVDFAIAFLILVGMMVYYGVAITWGLVMLPVLVALITLLALSIGMWTSALNVKYRDIGVALPVLIQLWMFASPIIYPSSLVPEKWRWLYALNPLVGIIEGFRAALFGREFDWLALAVSTIIALILLVYSIYTFRRMEKSFADVI